MRAIDLLGRRLAAMCDRVEDLALHNVRTRLARVLTELAESQDDQLVVTETQQEIAARIASRRDEVAKAVRYLREHGLVASRRGHPGITILDADRLASAGEETS